MDKISKSSPSVPSTESFDTQAAFVPENSQEPQVNPAASGDQGVEIPETKVEPKALEIKTAEVLMSPPPDPVLAPPPPIVTAAAATEEVSESSSEDQSLFVMNIIHQSGKFHEMETPEKKEWLTGRWNAYKAKYGTEDLDDFFHWIANDQEDDNDDDDKDYKKRICICENPPAKGGVNICFYDSFYGTIPTITVTDANRHESVHEGLVNAPDFDPKATISHTCYFNEINKWLPGIVDPREGKGDESLSQGVTLEEFLKHIVNYNKPSQEEKDSDSYESTEFFSYESYRHLLEQPAQEA